jgi:hypothetical protein
MDYVTTTLAEKYLQHPDLQVLKVISTHAGNLSMLPCFKGGGRLQAMAGSLPSRPRSGDYLAAMA